MNRLKRDIKVIGIYALMCYIALIPLNLGDSGISISLLLAFLFGLLNDIIEELRKLNGNNKNKQI